MGVGRVEDGQATVELALLLPLALIVAALAVNALCFFGECASFDRVFRESVCIHGASPSAGSSPADAASAVQGAIEQCLNRENVSVSVTTASDSLGYWTFEARLEYQATLFGLGLRDEILGVSIPPLVHRGSLTVDSFSPGGMLL